MTVDLSSKTQRLHRPIPDTVDLSGRIRSDTSRLAIALGVALTVVGWTDVALLAFNGRPWSEQWEFTITSLFGALPLGTIGIMVIALVCMAEAHPRALRALSILCSVIGFTLSLIAFLFFLRLPGVRGPAEFPVSQVILLAMVKTLILAGTYITLYFWAARACWLKTARLRLL